VLKSFSKTSPENSAGVENSAEISGTNGINFFCYMYESSLRHPVWVPEINVKAGNSAQQSKQLKILVKLVIFA
jgi:hypothetical protein